MLIDLSIDELGVVAAVLTQAAGHGADEYDLENYEFDCLLSARDKARSLHPDYDDAPALNEERP